MIAYIRRAGGDRHKNQGNNITLQRGDSAEYTLRRLKRDRPDLAEKVINEELSPNQAAIEAGFRKKKVAVNMDDPESAARTIKRYMDSDNVDALIRLLRGEC